MLNEGNFHCFKMVPTLGAHERKEKCDIQAEQLNKCNTFVRNRSTINVGEKAWTRVWAQLFCNTLFGACAIIGALLNRYSINDQSFQSMAMWIAWTSMVVGIVSVTCTSCYLRNFGLKQASEVGLFLVHLILIVHLILNIVAACFVAAIPISLITTKYWRGPHSLMVAARSVYIFATVVIVTELFISLGLLLGPLRSLGPYFLSENNVTIERESCDIDSCDV